MKRSGSIVALIGVLLLACAAVAWEWYSHMGGAPQPVQQIAAASPPASGAPSPSPAPVLYVPKATPTPPPPSGAPLSAAPTAPAGQATVVPSAVPTAAPSLAPYASAQPVLSSEPMVAATPAPHIVAVKPITERPDGPPRILAMSISTPVAHGGEVVSGTVETTSNVASVEARIAGYSSSLQKVGVGKFSLSYRVPRLPFFLHRTYTIEVIARNTHGDAVSSSVPITIR